MRRGAVLRKARLDSLRHMMLNGLGGCDQVARQMI